MGFRAFGGGLGAEKLVLFARKSYGVLLTEERARELKAQWLERWPTPPVEPCARIGCGHAKQAHEGHCHQVGTEVSTHCSQHCGCRRICLGSADDRPLLDRRLH